MEPIFTIEGTVVSGRQLGRTLGYPTANLKYPEGVQLPPDGVYAAEVRLPESRGTYKAMLNQGSHPTLPDGNHTIEIFLLDFDGDLYGCTLEADYLEYMRGERRFASVDELKAQLQKDDQSVRTWFAR